MVQCDAFNSIVTSSKGLSMFLFPTEPKMRKIWVDRLKRDWFSGEQVLEALREMSGVGPLRGLMYDYARKKIPLVLIPSAIAGVVWYHGIKAFDDRRMESIKNNDTWKLYEIQKKANIFRCVNSDGEYTEF